MKDTTPVGFFNAVGQLRRQKERSMKRREEMLRRFKPAEQPATEDAAQTEDKPEETPLARLMDDTASLGIIADGPNA